MAKDNGLWASLRELLQHSPAVAAFFTGIAIVAASFYGGFWLNKVEKLEACYGVLFGIVCSILAVVFREKLKGLIPSSGSGPAQPTHNPDPQGEGIKPPSNEIPEPSPSPKPAGLKEIDFARGDGVGNKDSETDRNDEMNIIAWEGFEGIGESLRLSETSRHTHLVEYERGIEKVNRLFLHSRPFDIVIADVEQFGRLDRQKRFDVIRDKPQFDEMFAKVARAIGGLIRPDILKFALPLRWGMNDLLINHERIKEVKAQDFLDRIRDNNCSWADFDLDKWIGSPGPGPIGLWNWYLPSLLCLSLSRRPQMGLSQARELPISDVKTLCESIRDAVIKGSVKLFSNAREARVFIRQGSVSMIIGGGSMMLPKQAHAWSGFVPKEGVFVWIECAGILGDPDVKFSEAVKYLGLLMSEQGQLALMKRPAYWALPVISDALREIRAYQGGNFSAAAKSFPLRNVLSADPLAFTKGKVELRIWPTAWRIWEGLWEWYVQDLNQKTPPWYNAVLKTKVEAGGNDKDNEGEA